jgi:hypothetical protein
MAGLPPSYDEAVNADEKKYYEDLIALRKENELLKQQLEAKNEKKMNLSKERIEWNKLICKNPKIELIEIFKKEIDLYEPIEIFKKEIDLYEPIKFPGYE